MSQNLKKTLVLVDDHHLVRAGLKLFIDYLPGYEVVGEASDGDEVMPLLAQRRPDILVTDISMRRVSAWQVLPQVRRQFPEVKVVVLSMHSDRETVRRALEEGALGYVVKDSTEQELQQALDTVGVGRRYVSPEVAGELFDELFTTAEDNTGPTLTERQREILRMVALGKGTKEIAFELGLSSKTVESHRAQMMERLAIRDIPTLVRYAIRNRIIDLDEGF